MHGQKTQTILVVGGGAPMGYTSSLLYIINKTTFMKRKTTIALCAFAGLLTFAPAQLRAQQSETASTTIYDLSKFDDVALLKLFAEIDAQGRKYPTAEELKTAGLTDELEFVRSHVRKRHLVSFDDRLVQKTYAQRELFMNIPSGAGKQVGGYPSKDFASDNYSMWNYTYLFGSWNHGLFQAPGAWTDAAHKNGTDIMAGIKFFDTTGGRGQGATPWIQLISQKNTDGSYKYARPMINLLRYLGMDGINYNWETGGVGGQDVVNFHQKLYEIAAEEKFDNFHIVIYTMNSGLQSYGAAGVYGSNGKRTAEVMLNYDGSGFSRQMGASVRTAKSLLSTSHGVYAGGWIVGMDKNWSSLDKDNDTHECGIALWGEHDQSRFWSYNTGRDPQERMSNYQMYLERAFSGGNRNPGNLPAITDGGHNVEWSGSTPPLAKFPGLAHWFPERSTVKGTLPFATYFNTGNGERYVYKGKKTAGSWYNMSNQDIVPTYRWLVYEGGTLNTSNKIQPEFTNKDAYNGGACLLLSGTADATATDVVLYKTELQGTAGTIYANVAIKSGKATPEASNLYLIVRLKNTAKWKEFEIGNTPNANWVEHRVKLDGISSTDVIDRIGLRVKNSTNTYRMMVGKLALTDDFSATPSKVKDLAVQVKEETRTSLSVKASWQVDKALPESGMLYNDEANIDHFEVLYKNGEDGRVSEIARTSQWAAYVGDIELPNVADRPFIGVRAVATDLKTYSPVVWKEVTRAAQNSLPVRKDTKYGIPELDTSANGAEIARKYRYIEKFTSENADENITYETSKPAGGTNYVDATDKVIKVHQGQTITIRLKGYEATQYKDGTVDDLRYCMGRGWLDLNGDGQFNPANVQDDPNNGECLFFVGKVRASTTLNVQGMQPFTFTIPNDAHVGRTRLRIVFSDAWFQGALQPVGKFNKGFAIDFGVEITGTNPSRTGVDTWDKGMAEQPEGLNTSTGIGTLTAKTAAVNVADGKLNFANVDKAWIFSVDGTLMQTLVRPASYGIKALPKGIYLIKMQTGDAVTTQKVTL